MTTMMERSAALGCLYAADRLRAEAMLPTLSLQQRKDKLSECCEDDDLPAITAHDDPADMALGIFRTGGEANPRHPEDEWYFRRVRPDFPDDPGNPRYDKVILQVLPGDRSYYGVTNQYLSEALANIGHPNATVLGEPEILHPCPCCGYRTLDQIGEYDICKVCFWEDDGNRDPSRYSGPNHMTLGAGRRNYQTTGACDPSVLRSVDRKPGKYVRAIDYSQE